MENKSKLTDKDNANEVCFVVNECELSERMAGADAQRGDYDKQSSFETCVKLSNTKVTPLNGEESSDEN